MPAPLPATSRRWPRSRPRPGSSRRRQTGLTLLVTGNGEGAGADDDVIALQYTDDPTSDREDGDDDSSTDLARGNAQVYDGR